MIEIHVQTSPASCLDGIDGTQTPDGISVSIAEVSKYAIGWDDCLIAVLAITGDVTSRVIAMWLYDALFVHSKKQPKKMRIANRDIDLQTKNVVRAMEEAIEAQNRNRSQREQDG